MSAVFMIDGVNILPFIAERGIKWQRQDVDGPNAGRTMDTVMHRDRQGIKIRMDISCLSLSGEDAHTVLNAILPEYVSVTYEDPMYGIRTAVFYSNNVPATCGTYYEDGSSEWEGITFPLVEV